MADLRACFEDMGLKDVKTFLQSGNVTFDSGATADDLKRKIEAALAETFGYPAKVQVKSIGDLQEIIAANPFGVAPDNHHQYVIFFETGLEKAFSAEAAGSGGEKVRAGSSVVYWQVDRGRTLKSPVGKLLTKSKYRDFHTNRNIRTLQKIAEAT